MPYIKPLDFEEEIRQYRSVHFPPLSGAQEVGKNNTLFAKCSSKEWTHLPAITSKNCQSNFNWQRKKRKKKMSTVLATQQEKDDAQKAEEERRARKRKKRFKMAGMETKSYVIFSDESGKSYSVIEEETRPSTATSFSPELDEVKTEISLRFMRINGRTQKPSNARKKTQKLKQDQGL